jgi:hypothetical protein
MLAPVIRDFQLRQPDLPDHALLWAAKQNMTRGWIELVAQQALQLGYDAVQGRELDSKSGQGISRSWMAVMRADAITAPDWVLSVL